MVEKCDGVRCKYCENGKGKICGGFNLGSWGGLERY
jgi:hypothetical protein